MAGERLGDGYVGPEPSGQDQLEPASEAGARAQYLAAPVLFDVAAIVEPEPLAVEVELEQGGIVTEGRERDHTLKLTLGSLSGV